MTRSRYLIICMALFSLPYLALASDSKGATAAIPFVRIIQDPARAATGGTAYAALSSWSVNPGVIPFGDHGFEANASWQSYNVKNEIENWFSVCSGWKIDDRFGISASLDCGLCPEYNMVGAGGVENGSFSPSEAVFRLGVGWKFLPKLSLGINLKYAHTSLAPDYNYGALMADVFVTGIIDKVTYAAGVSSIGGNVKDASGRSFSLPSSLSAGIGWKAIDVQEHNAVLSLDADWYFSGSITTSIGAEYSFFNRYFARVGYRYASDKAPLASFASAGLGISLFGVQLDFSYLFASPTISGTLLAGLSYRF